jgi:hypothetical protein
MDDRLPSRGVDPIANEAAIRFLAAENERIQLMLAQAVGNIALLKAQLDELRAHT